MVKLHNDNAEQALIGGVIRDNRAYHEVCDIINTDSFYYPAHKQIWSSVSFLLEQGNPADQYTIADHLGDNIQQVGGWSYIIALINGAPPSISEHHARIVQDYATRRKIDELSIDLHKYATETTGIDMIVDMAQQRAYELNINNGKRGPRRIGDDIAGFIERIENRQIKGKPTGYYDVDNLLGGFKPGCVYIIAADTGMGKTTLALNIGLYYAQHDESVVFFSLEMEYSDLVDRIACSLARVDSSVLQTGQLTDQDAEAIAKQTATLDRLPFLIDDDGGVTPSQIRSRMRRLKKKPSLIILDYVQLMNPGTRWDNEVNRIAYSSQAMVRIAKDFDVPIILISQLNRSEEARKKERKPTLASLRGSGSLEQDAYAVLFIYRQAYHWDAQKVADMPIDDVRRAEIIIAKNRGGRVGSAFLNFVGEYNLFENRENYRGDRPIF